MPGRRTKTLSTARDKPEQKATGTPEIGKAATLVMLQPSAPAREPSVDARTVAALDAITAFADPNPNCSSQNQSVFSGLVARQVALPSRSLSLLRSGKVYFANPFSRRRQPN